jgi:hypothetical protein
MRPRGKVFWKFIVPSLLPVLLGAWWGLPGRGKPHKPTEANKPAPATRGGHTTSLTISGNHNTTVAGDHNVVGSK